MQHKKVLLPLLVLLSLQTAAALDYSVPETPPYQDNLFINASEQVTLNIKHASETNYTSITGSAINHTGLEHIGRYQWYLERNEERTQKKYFFYNPTSTHPYTDTALNSVNNLDVSCNPSQNDTCTFEHEHAKLIQLYSEAHRATQNEDYKQKVKNITQNTWVSGSGSRCDPTQGDFSCGKYNLGGNQPTTSGAYRQSIIIDSLWNAYLSLPNQKVKEYAQNFSNTPSEDCNHFQNNFSCYNGQNENALYAQAYITAYTATLKPSYKDFAQGFINNIQNESSIEAKNAFRQAKSIGLKTPQLTQQKPNITTKEQQYALIRKATTLYHETNTTTSYDINNQTVSFPTKYVAQRYAFHQDFQTEPSSTYDYEKILEPIRLQQINKYFPPHQEQTTRIQTSQPIIGQDLTLHVYDKGNITTQNITVQRLSEQTKINTTFPGIANIPAEDIQQSQFIELTTNTGKETTVTIPITSNYLDTANNTKQAPPRRFCNPFQDDFSCSFEYMQALYAEKGSQKAQLTQANWFTQEFLTTKAAPNSSLRTTCEIGQEYTCLNGSGAFSEPGLYRAGTLASANIQGYRETGNQLFLDRAARYLYNNHAGCGYQSSLDCDQKSMGAYLEGITKYLETQPEQELQIVADGIKTNILAQSTLNETALNALLSYYQYNNSETLLQSIADKSQHLQGTCILQGECEPRKLYAQTKLFWDLYKETQENEFYQEANSLSQTQPQTEQDACNPNTQNQGTEKNRCFYPDEQGLLIDSFLTAATQNVIQDEINLSADIAAPQETPFQTQTTVACTITNIDNRDNTQPFTLQLLSDQTIDNIDLTGTNATNVTIDDTLVRINEIGQQEIVNATYTINTTRGGEDQYTCSALGEQSTQDTEINQIGNVTDITQTEDTAFFQNNFTTTYTLENIHPFTLQNVTIQTTLPIQNADSEETITVTDKEITIPNWRETGSQLDTTIDIQLEHNSTQEITENQTFTVTGDFGIDQTQNVTTTTLPNTVNTTSPHPKNLKLFQQKEHNVTVTNTNSFNLTNLTINPERPQGINVLVNNTANKTIPLLEPGQKKNYTVTYNVTDATSPPSQLTTTYQSPQVDIQKETSLIIDTTYLDIQASNKEVPLTSSANHTITITSPIYLEDIDITYQPQPNIQEKQLLNTTRNKTELVPVTSATSQTQGNVTQIIQSPQQTLTTTNLTLTTDRTKINALKIESPNTTSIQLNNNTCNLTPPTTQCPTSQSTVNLTSQHPVNITTIQYNVTGVEGKYGTAQTLTDILPGEERNIILTTHNHDDLPQDITITTTSQRGATGSTTFTLEPESSDGDSGSGDSNGASTGSGGAGGAGLGSGQDTETQEDQTWTYMYNYSTRNVYSALTPSQVQATTAQRSLQPLSTQPCFNITKTATTATPHRINIDAESCLDAETYTVYYETPEGWKKQNTNRPDLQASFTLRNTTYTEQELNNTPYLLPTLPGQGAEGQTTRGDVTQAEQENMTEESVNETTPSTETERPPGEHSSTAFKIPIPTPTTAFTFGTISVFLGIFLLFIDNAKKRGVYTKTKLKYLKAKDKFKEDFSKYKKHHERLTPQENKILALKLRLRKIEMSISENRWKQAQKHLERYRDYVESHSSQLETVTSKRGEQKLEVIAERLEKAVEQIQSHRTKQVTPTKQKTVREKQPEKEDNNEQQNPSPSIYLKIKRSYVLLNQKNYKKALQILHTAREQAEDLKELYPEESTFLTKKIDETEKKVERIREQDKIHQLKLKTEEILKHVQGFKDTVISKIKPS